MLSREMRIGFKYTVDFVPLKDGTTARFYATLKDMELERDPVNIFRYRFVFQLWSRQNDGIVARSLRYVLSGTGNDYVPGTISSRTFCTNHVFCKQNSRDEARCSQHRLNIKKAPQ